MWARTQSRIIPPQWSVGVTTSDARCELRARTNENKGEMWVANGQCITDGDRYKWGCQRFHGQTTTMARRKRQQQPTTTQAPKRRRHIQFPCVVCHEEVRSDQAALLCDGCNKWQHLDCQSGTNSVTINLQLAELPIGMRQLNTSYITNGRKYTHSQVCNSRLINCMYSNSFYLQESRLLSMQICRTRTRSSGSARCANRQTLHPSVTQR